MSDAPFACNDICMQKHRFKYNLLMDFFLKETLSLQYHLLCDEASLEFSGQKCIPSLWFPLLSDLKCVVST